MVRSDDDGGVCILHIKPRSFYPSTSSTTSARADSSILQEIQVLWSHARAYRAVLRRTRQHTNFWPNYIRVPTRLSLFFRPAGVLCVISVLWLFLRPAL